MYFVYILKSQKNGRYYVGSTNNPERRLKEHNSGKTPSLKYLRPLEFVFLKEFEKEIDARRIEKKIKNFKNREIINRIVTEQKLIMGL